MTISTTTPIDPIRLLRPQRPIEGISAILLPFLDDSGTIDWPGFRAHVERTAASGLVPAVNMDTGYVNLLDDATRARVLEEARGVLGSRPFVAGAFVADRPGAAFDVDGYLRRIEAILTVGATPAIFQSYGLVEAGDEAIIGAYETLGRACGRFIAFELGTMFAPFGRIYSLGVYEQLMKISACIGAKHSSLCREDEWRRLMLRDAVRPDFRVYTGNDLAIDMVMYGSDYLLGLSTFAPDLFARRDAYWAAGDPAFYELNDTLQYLGAFAFRPPVPAYKHSAAMFLALRGWIERDATHPSGQRRPDSDRDVLRAILDRLGVGGGSQGKPSTSREPFP
jgi:dihydrodipicolinate synthase/N-acetylneuraminate lyase